MNIALYFAAMWVSEIWNGRYERTGCIYARARSIVLHDRILNERIPVLMDRCGQKPIPDNVFNLSRDAS